MKIQLVHRHYDEKHLTEVIEEMKKLGTPKIKAIWCAELDAWLALEGCHRLRAAFTLGLTPIIEDVSETYCDVELEVIRNAYNEPITAEELYEELRWNINGTILIFRE